MVSLTSPVVRPLLLVDDDEDIPFFLGRACVKAGLEFPQIVKTTAEAAVIYFNECISGAALWPYVVFLDIRLSGKSGFELLVWLQERKLLGNFVIAMVSDSLDPKDISRAFSLGAHAFVGKTPTAEKLIELVQQAVKLFGAPRPSHHETLIDATDVCC